MRNYISFERRILMKKLLAILLCVSLMLSMMVLTAAAADEAVTFWDGKTYTQPSGSGDREDDPYIVSTPAELAWMVNVGGNNKYFKLANDIYVNDVTAENWTETAKPWFVNATNWMSYKDSAGEDKKFSGHIDGAGHTVYGIYCDGSVGMGCQYPEGREANIYNDVVAAKYVNQNWPTPILYSTWEVGNPVLTASRETLDRMDENNPIRVGYEEHFRNLKYGIPRPSWDPITAYFACAGFSEYYDLHRADVAIDNVGNSVFFDNETTGARAYLIKKDNVTNEQMAAILDDKMVAAEGRIENGLYCDYFDDTDSRLVKNSTNASTVTVTHAFIGREWFDTYYKSEDIGASIELTFEGTSFTIYGGYLTSGGIVDIYLDGKLIDSVDTYNSTNYLSSHLYHKDGLSKSTHTLKLVTSDKKNSASSGNSFLFDFVKVDTFDVLKGDVNGDGNIDVCDLVATKNIISGKAPSCSAADMNSDGKIDSLDTAELRKLIISK